MSFTITYKKVTDHDFYCICAENERYRITINYDGDYDGDLDKSVLASEKSWASIKSKCNPLARIHVVEHEVYMEGVSRYIRPSNASEVMSQLQKDIDGLTEIQEFYDELFPPDKRFVSPHEPSPHLKELYDMYDEILKERDEMEKQKQ